MRHGLLVLLVACEGEGEGAGAEPFTLSVPGDAAPLADPDQPFQVSVELASDLVFEGREEWPSLLLRASSGTWVGQEGAELSVSLAEPSFSAWLRPEPTRDRVIVEAVLTARETPIRRSLEVDLCPADLGQLTLSTDPAVVGADAPFVVVAEVRTPSGGPPSPGTRVVVSLPDGVRASSAEVATDAAGDASYTLWASGAPGTEVPITVEARRPSWADCPEEDPVMATATVWIQ